MRTEPHGHGKENVFVDTRSRDEAVGQRVFREPRKDESKGYGDPKALGKLDSG